MVSLTLFFGQLQCVDDDTHRTYFILVTFKHLVECSIAIEVIDVAITTNGLEDLVLCKTFSR